MDNAIPEGPLHHSITFQEDNYPYWKNHFPEPERKQMIEDDVLAAESVSGLLFSVLFLGVLLGVTTVALIVWKS